MLAGMLIGLIIAVAVVGSLVWILNHQPQQTFKETAKPAPQPEQVSPPPAASAEPPAADALGALIGDITQKHETAAPAKNESLPETPAPAASAQKDPAAILNGRTPAKTASGSRVRLQMGAFSSLKQAEIQQAKLAMLDISVQITPVQSNGRTLYQVRSGAMDTAQAENLKKDLKSQGIDSFIITSK